MILNMKFIGTLITLLERQINFVHLQIAGNQLQAPHETVNESTSSLKISRPAFAANL